MVCSSAGLHLSVWMRASVCQAVTLAGVGGVGPVWGSEALETGRTGSAELTDLYKAGWFMCCPG